MRSGAARPPNALHTRPPTTSHSPSTPAQGGARGAGRGRPQGRGVRMRGGASSDLGRGGARRDADGGSMTGGGKRRSRAAEPAGEQVAAGERAGGRGRRVRRSARAAPASGGPGSEGGRELLGPSGGRAAAVPRLMARWLRRGGLVTRDGDVPLCL